MKPVWENGRSEQAVNDIGSIMESLVRVRRSKRLGVPLGASQHMSGSDYGLAFLSSTSFPQIWASGFGESLLDAEEDSSWAGDSVMNVSLRVSFFLFFLVKPAREPSPRNHKTAIERAVGDHSGCVNVGRE